MRTTNYAALLGDLYKGTPITFSRFGDGEFNCIFGDVGAPPNVDGHVYFPKLGARLLKILKATPDYVIGIQPMARRTYHSPHPRCEVFEELTSAYSTSADLLHLASIRGQFYSMFEALKSREVVLVGPAYLRALSSFTFEMVEVPLKNCWVDRNRIAEECAAHYRFGVVFLFCASMPAKCWIHDLWTSWPDGTFLDFGSVLDPYAGKFTRQYHRRLKLRL